MPTLPTLTVTDPQMARIFSAFGSQDAYRSWLRRVLINEVVNRESSTLRTDLETQLGTVDAPAIGTSMTAPPAS